MRWSAAKNRAQNRGLVVSLVVKKLMIIFGSVLESIGFSRRRSSKKTAKVIIEHLRKTSIEIRAFYEDDRLEH
jgi:hypothetical protein